MRPGPRHAGPRHHAWWRGPALPATILAVEILAILAISVTIALSPTGAS